MLGNFLMQGSIRLRLWLSTREDRGLSEEEDMWNEIRQQESIYSIFLEHQLKQHVSQTSVLSTGKNKCNTGIPEGWLFAAVTRPEIRRCKRQGLKVVLFPGCCKGTRLAKFGLCLIRLRGRKNF